MKVCILDYGSGNVKSVYRAILRITNQVVISNDKYDIQNSSHLILPGVGSFPAAMKKIQSKIDTQLLYENLQAKKPFLGICVGMQVLASIGNEFESTKGLDLLEESIVDRIVTVQTLPHIGWNSVKFEQDSELFDGMSSGLDFYFLHSFIFTSIKKEFIIGSTDYDVKFPSAIRKENVYGVQFHPEKSQSAGEKLLANFLKIK